MIPQSKIEEIISAAPIEQVVGEVVKLKRAGSNMQGLCPFHTEKTPSFSVSPSKGIFKCFGCGKAGNVVNFVMENEALGYLEALKSLAERYGVEWPRQENFNIDQERQQKTEKESLQVINNWAASYFENQLWETETGRLIGLSYFEERGFREDIIRKFRLGYAQEEWSAFYDEALKSQFNEEILLSSGLVKKSEQGKVYDAYRGRVIFPILGSTGKMIAFAGRQLKKDEKSPKYVNSPETLLYHKSNELYGLFQARNSIRKEDFVYLVEGYTDVISLHQAGIENVVASSGTSLTENQIKLIKRQTEHVTVLYDGDAAGIKASLRGIDMLLEQGLNVRVVLFPDGEDPDSYCKKVGPEEFANYLKRAVRDFILFKVELLLKDSGKDPIKRATVIRDIIESISKIPDAIKRMAFVRECSVLLDMNEQVLVTELNKLRTTFLGEKEKEWVKTEPEQLNYEEEIQELVQKDKGSLYQEQHLLKLMILHGNREVRGQRFLDLVFKMAAEGQIGFENEVPHVILGEIHRLAASGEPVTEAWFKNHSNPVVSAFAADVLIDRYTMSPKWETKYDIIMEKPDKVIENDIESCLYYLQLHVVRKLLLEGVEHLKELAEQQREEELKVGMEIVRLLKEREMVLTKANGLVIFQ
ncbi:MAG: DNA primase [Bacteroidetes bacterium]|nr:DNA primase [Bacteroidota bacterium]